MDDSPATTAPAPAAAPTAAAPTPGPVDDLDFAGSLNTHRIAVRLLQAVTRSAGDWSVLVLLDERGHSCTCYGGDDVRRETVAATSAPLRRLLGGDEPQVLAVSEDRGTLEELGVLPDPDLRTQVAALRPVELLAVPVGARGAAFGVLLVARGSGRGFDQAGVDELTTTTGRAAQALHSARMYEHHARSMEVLEAGLRPPALPALPGIELAATFRSAVDHLHVGGDFYDVHPGQDDCLVIIGDVCGKGVDAAVLNSRARQTVRTAAFFDRDPGKVLDALSDVLYDDESSSFVTALCVRLQAAGAGLDGEVASAGHPAPLVLAADGTVTPVPVRGLIAGGVRRSEPHEVVRFRLPPGDTLVLYTDGVTEARGPRGFYDERRLASLLTAYTGADPQTLCEAVERDVFEHLAGAAHDDVTAVVLRAAAGAA